MKKYSIKILLKIIFYEKSVKKLVKFPLNISNNFTVYLTHFIYGCVIKDWYLIKKKVVQYLNSYNDLLLGKIIVDLNDMWWA